MRSTRRRTLTAALCAVLAILMLALVSCGGGGAKNISAAKSIADLAGAKIAAQAGTFHADALNQISKVQGSTYPEFADLLIALKSGAIDGYIAEEPTALAICLSEESLDYLHFVNNDTGFEATDADTGIAVGLKKGSELTARINEALAKVTTEQIGELAVSTAEPENPVGTLKVAMECAYEPFNWTDLGTPSAGAVAIYEPNGQPAVGRYANGYDVQIARYIAASLGMKLEIYALEWDSLIPAVQAGTVDAIVAGMSPTAERAKEIDFSSVYYSSNLVVIIKK